MNNEEILISILNNKQGEELIVNKLKDINYNKIPPLRAKGLFKTPEYKNLLDQSNYLIKIQSELNF